MEENPDDRLGRARGRVPHGHGRVFVGVELVFFGEYHGPSCHAGEWSRNASLLDPQPDGRRPRDRPVSGRTPKCQRLLGGRDTNGHALSARLELHRGTLRRETVSFPTPGVRHPGSRLLRLGSFRPLRGERDQVADDLATCIRSPAGRSTGTVAVSLRGAGQNFAISPAISPDPAANTAMTNTRSNAILPNMATVPNRFNVLLRTGPTSGRSQRLATASSN